MKKIVLMAALALLSIGCYAQEQEQSNEKDLNDALKDINSSNPLPFSHQGIEKSTDENDRELNNSSNSNNNESTRDTKNNNNSSNDPEQNKRKRQQ